MVAWVVIYRRHFTLSDLREGHRQAGRFAMLLSTPSIPLSHLSPLLPYSYGHSYTTATHQPLCNQSVTHSFDLHGGVYPPRGLDCPSPTPYPLLGPCKTRALRSGWFYGTDRSFRPCLTGSPFLSHPCAHFRTFLRFFAPTKNSTRFFSSVSALFAKNTRGGYRVCVATTSHGQELFEAKHLFAICCGRDPQKLSTHTDSVPTTSLYEEK